MLSLISTPALSEPGTYVITFKDGPGGTVRGASTFNYDPVAGLPNPVAINVTWTQFSDFSINGTVSSFTTHATGEGPNSGPSRVRGVNGTFVNPTDQFIFSLNAAAANNSEGTWTITLFSDPLNPEQGFYDLRNITTVTNINQVPEPATGLILLTGLLPLGLMIRRRKLSR